jgi:hypothetical protein
MVNDITSETMLIIYLKEAFINEFDPVINTTNEENNSQETDVDMEYTILGEDTVNPFDKIVYTIENIEGGD